MPGAGCQSTLWLPLLQTGLPPVPATSTLSSLCFSLCHGVPQDQGGDVQGLYPVWSRLRLVQEAGRSTEPLVQSAHRQWGGHLAHPALPVVEGGDCIMGMFHVLRGGWGQEGSDRQDPSTFLSPSIPWRTGLGAGLSCNKPIHFLLL